MTAKHGLGSLKQALKVRGMNALDRRTSPVRLMESFRSELLVSLGGEDALSAQELALVEMVVRTKLLRYSDATNLGNILRPPVVMVTS